MSETHLQAQIDELLTWERVRAWAEQQPAQCFVGRANTGYACPLAAYLKEQPGIPDHLCVGVAAVGTKLDAKLPHWATKVVLAVDGPHGDDDVLREEFIDILDKYKPQEA